MRWIKTLLVWLVVVAIPVTLGRSNLFMINIWHDHWEGWHTILCCRRYADRMVGLIFGKETRTSHVCLSFLLLKSQVWNWIWQYMANPSDPWCTTQQHYRAKKWNRTHLFNFCWVRIHETHSKAPIDYEIDAPRSLSCAQFGTQGDWKSWKWAVTYSTTPLLLQSNGVAKEALQGNVWHVVV